MPETKKLAVAFDPSRPNSRSSDFLYPVEQRKRIVFRGIRSGVEQQIGTIVYIGRAITENDIFAKLVDSAKFLESVDKTLACFRRYIDQLQAFKIGNVIRIRDSSDAEFNLELVANSLSALAKKTTPE